MKRSKSSFALTIFLSLAALNGLCMPFAQAAASQSIAPEVVARVWQEDNSEIGSVSLNGKELITFKGEPGSLSAEKAEDLASKIQDLLDDHKIDPNNLLPAKANGLAAIQAEGTTVMTFEPPAAGKDSASAMDVSFKLVNGIRTACGVPTVPASFLTLQESAGGNQTLGGSFSGQASWYGPHFHGHKTSDGSRYDQELMTAAHRSLPFGTRLLVMNRKTGQTCVVKINDRGPFVGHRVIDLSKGAARQLKMLGSGVALVDCLVLGNN